MRDPDVKGSAASAWRVKMPAEGGRADWAATISGWLINGSSFHPMWTWWALSVVHLRDIPGGTPARKRYQEAEYEFLIASIDPAHPPDPDDPAAGFRFMTPIDVSIQFHGVTDEQAAKLAEHAIHLITAGLASPDQDYRSWWGTTIANSLVHLKAGADIIAQWKQ